MIFEGVVISFVIWWIALLVLIVPFGNKVYQKAIKDGKTTSSERSYLYFEYPGNLILDCLKDTPCKHLAIAFLLGAFPLLGFIVGSLFTLP